MKKFSSIAILSALLSSTTINAAGIPVFDAASVAQAVQQGIQLKQQIENQLMQIKEMQSQLAAIKGSRGMGDLARKAINYDLDIPAEWADLHKLNNTQQQGRLKEKYDSNQSDKLLNQNITQLSHFLSENQKRIQVIDGLINQINQTTDIKASADLRNRLSAEQLKFQNQQTMLDQMARMYELQEKVHARQHKNRSDCFARNLSTGNYDSCK